MGTNVNWANPYADREGCWCKGDMHVHCTAGSGCAKMTPEEALDAYAAAGFDFIAMSDHFVLTVLHDDRLVLIPGMEWTGLDQRHTGIYSPRLDLIEQVRRTAEQADALTLLAGGDGFTMVNHPNWKRNVMHDHYSEDALDAAGPFDAMEIWNFGGRGAAGKPEATDKWDHVLTAGRRVLGVAATDAHHPRSVAQACIYLRAKARTLEAIFAALRSGNFYCSAGVVLDDIRREGDRIIVEAADAEELQLIGTHGRELCAVRGQRLEFDLSSLPAEPAIDYVRIEAYGVGSSKAWTQPFYVHG